jgi:Got1/Sft2-like family
MLRGRGGSTASMGLLDGLSMLQGAPPPRGDPLATFGNGARSLVGDLSQSLSGGVDALGSNAKSASDSLRRMLGDESVNVDLEGGGDAGGQQTMSEEMGALFNLSMMQRITLFAMCFTAGVVLILISLSFLPLILVLPHKFAAPFTMGNVLAIMSTWILVGPRAQLRTMFHPQRAGAATAYVASLVFVLFAAFFGGRLRYLLVIAALIVEIAALCWYSLSYIPYGRHLISQLCGVTSWSSVGM